MKYGVIGTGALGGYYGGRLAEAGKDVHFLFRSDYQHIQEYGLKVNSTKGNFVIHPINAYKKVTEMPKCDVILVCLKTTNNHLLQNLLPPIIHEETIVILIQNGLGVEEDLQSAFPKLHIAGGLAFICARKNENGFVEHLDEGELKIGAYSPHISKLKLLEIAADFEEAKVDTEIVDLNKARWQKLLWNIPFNGLSVVLNTSTDQLLKNKHTKHLLYDIMQEVILAANHCGIDLLPKYADRILAETEKMIPYSPSMKLDFENKRPLEILYIYTKPIAAGTLAGIEMPRVSMLEKELRYIEAQYVK